MKHLVTTLLTFALTLHLPLFAGIPQRWTVETTRAQPATFEAYQGETLDFEASLMNAGKPLEAPLNYSFFWQTNGMGSTYWKAPCTGGTGVSPVGSVGPDGTGVSPVQSNVLFATWLPSYDVGARVYNCFIGSPSNNYHTAFQLRLRPSPGANPNALPLPQPVIDFARVRVLNPPWESGGGGGFDTNAVIDIIHKTVDGAARPLPKYLWLYEAADSYPAEAQEYYRSRGDGKVDGGCSSVRDGGFLSRNFDFPFDNRSEFVVKMSAGPNRFASVGVSQVGTNLTEEIVTSGKPEFSARYKWLPGATVDGINERGVMAEINVVDGSPQTNGWHTTGDIHPLAAVRWSLDNGTSAGMVASNLASRIAFPQGWAQNFHWMVADESQTWIVENGTASNVTGRAVMTNFSMFETWATGGGLERYNILVGGEPITNAWFTRAYSRQTYWISDFRDAAEMEAAKTAWETHAREELRGKGMWQTVHTSVYDITNRTLRVAVQEVDDWYTFSVPGGTGVSPVKARAIAEDVASSKLDKADVIDPLTATTNGPAADAKATADALARKMEPDDEADPVFEGWVTGDDAKRWLENNETDPTVPDWAKVETPPWMDDGTGSPMFNGNVGGLAYGGIGSPFGSPCIKFDELAGMFFVSYYGMDPFFIEPAPDISGKADRAELTAATNEVIHVIKDAAKNLKYTITGDNGRFYMTPIGAINPED